MNSQHQLESPQEKPGLRLDLSTLDVKQKSPSRSLSPTIPSLRVTSSPTGQAGFAPPSPSYNEKFLPVNRTQTELQKLLAHLLARLKNRSKPPSIYQGLRAESARKQTLSLGAVVETVRSAVRFKSAAENTELSLGTRVATEDTNDDNEQDFSTDDTYEDLLRLRDLLILAERQKLQILGPLEKKRDSSSLRRLRRLSSGQSNKRSPSPPRNDTNSPSELLTQCIDILSSVVLDDARYKASSAKLTRPTYALQAMCLDIAQILVGLHLDNAKVLSMISFAMIPAFSTFALSLHSRLLAFFEEALIRRMLEDLQDSRGLDDILFKGTDNYLSPSKNPVVAIQVDDADDSGGPGWKQWTSALAVVALSATAPSQSLNIYYLSSLIPPLLAAILDAMDPFQAPCRDVNKLYRFHRLLQTIVTLKQDAYLDVLEIIAYHSATIRKRALSVLSTYWPKALGHSVIGKALPIVGYEDILAAQSGYVSVQERVAPPPRDAPYAHEFIPWRFDSSASKPGPEVLPNSCHACSKPIDEFGLLCPFCTVGVHMNCYGTPDGTFHGEYEPSKGADPRPCYFSFSHVLSPQRNMEPRSVIKENHIFRLVNLFTLALCTICEKPLWGHSRQGVRCVSCHKFAHSACVGAAGASLPQCRSSGFSNVLIDYKTLRESFTSHYWKILLAEEEIGRRPYEEISIYYSILWTQLRLFEHGINNRSTIVKQSGLGLLPGQRDSIAEFELHRYVRFYEKHLASNRSVMSEALNEYLDFNNKEYPTGNSILYDWLLLTSITSLIKSPLAPHVTSNALQSNLLQVSEQETEENGDSHPYELLSLSQARAALGHEFNLHADCAARYLLQHISQIGFLDRIDNTEDLFEGAQDSVLCAFPLPSGLDLSTSVETLVVAIQSCLSDIDISVNEYGFLLLARRFEPTGAASEYALTRLTGIILSWICSDDDRLIIVARDYIGQRLGLPGVRTAEDLTPWPPVNTRQASKTAVSSGGEYVQCRKQLLSRYALPWLASVHGLDPGLYAECLYGFCTEMAEASDPLANIGSPFGQDNQQKSIQSHGEIVLRIMTKLLQANATFTVFGDLLTRWFDSVSMASNPSGSLNFKFLPRLFGTEDMRRTSTVNDPSQTQLESTQVDPWDIFNSLAFSDAAGLERSLLWLRIMALSAVDIPIETLRRLFQQVIDCHAPIRTIVMLLECTMTSLWLKALSGYEIHKDVIRIHSLYAEEFSFRMQSGEGVEDNLNFLRYSLVICLLAFGCDRQVIETRELLSQKDIQQFPQRRKAVIRRGSAPHDLHIDPELVPTLSRYVSEGSDAICTLVAKFLAILVSESALLEQEEIDQFFLSNTDVLAECAWRFYNLKAQDMVEIRMSFLTRLLVVDSQSLDRLLRGQLTGQTPWQIRFQTVSRMFRIILDINNPSFGVLDRQWKTCIPDIINHFFCALWLDDREEIRLGVETWTRTLLPAHLDAISICWNEYMLKAPIADRAKLAAFLVQLHTHFPSWQVLPWQTIVDFLMDEETLHNDVNGTTEDSKGNRDQDIISLRASLTILCLQLVADGGQIDLFTLYKIKLVVARALGFHAFRMNITPQGQASSIIFGTNMGFTEISFGCITPLLRVLDSFQSVNLPVLSSGQIWSEQALSGLIGDVFVDIVVKVFETESFRENATELPYIVMRGLLECMLLIIVKHDLSSPILRALEGSISKAIENISSLLQLETNYEIRRLCITVMIAFLQSYPTLALRKLGHQIEIVTRLAALLRFNSDDPLVSRAKEFLEIAFTQYEVAGLFWLLSKDGLLSEDFFKLLQLVVQHSNIQAGSQKESLRDSVVRDTLSKVAANISDAATPNALHNLERYVAVCYHEPYPIALIQNIGLRLTAIARQTTDLNVSASYFDPNHLLLMSATIIQYNSSFCSELLSHTETLLRTALTRFNVLPATLKRLFEAIRSMYRWTESGTLQGTDTPANSLAGAVLDILSDALKGKVRVKPSTFTAILEILVPKALNESSYFHGPLLLRVAGDAVTYLSYPTYREGHGQTDFTASLTTAKLILKSGQEAPSLFRSILGDTRSPVAVRVWNLLVLATLEYDDPGLSGTLLTFLPQFVSVYAAALRIPSPLASHEFAALNVNYAFASLKLWILLARKTHASSELDAAERMVWNELWPPFERLFVQSLEESSNTDKPPVFTFISGCVSGIMLFLRQARSVIALDTSSHVSILNTLRASSYGEGANAKFVRAERSISESPLEAGFDVLLAQAQQDVLTAEKLHNLQLLDSNRQNAFDKRRDYADRSRTALRELRTQATQQ